MEKIDDKDLVELIGESRLEVFRAYSDYVKSAYEMEESWGKAYKEWKVECKYRRGGKTLCAFYFKEGGLGLMVIFGKVEREKVEQARGGLSVEVMKTYDDAKTYHDGKWVMFNLTDLSLLDDIKTLLTIKRRPNKK